MNLRDETVTLRRSVRFLGRSAYLIAASVAGLAASSALIALAWFLRIFAGSWPEMLRDPGTRFFLQALILAPVAVVAAAVALMDFPVPQPRTFISSIFVLVAGTTVSIAIIFFAVGMRNHQWDAGMGVAYSWRPDVFLLQLFMTRWGGYATALAIACSVIVVAARALAKVVRAGAAA